MNKNYQDFKGKLFRKDINKRVLFSHLKLHYSFEEQKYIISKIPKTFESLVFGMPLFKSIKDFGTKKLSYVNSIETELNWLVHLFKKYANELNLFLELKVEFETQFLLGEYKKSKEKLEEIKSISYSYWGLENNFLQTQYEEGLEYNFKLLNKSRNQDISDPAFFYLVHFFSCKVEEDISYFGYVNNLENSLNWGMNGDYKSYFLYRLNTINHDYKNIGAILWASSNLSIIDKYIIYKDIVTTILSNDNSISNSYNISEQCRYLSDTIKDPFLDKVNVIISLNTFCKNITSEKENELIDLFTQGAYQDVICGAKELFKKSISFSIIEIFVKSHIYLKISIETIGNENSMLNTIVELIYKILSRNENSNEAIIELLTKINTLSSFEIAKEIVPFLSYQINKFEKNENSVKAFLLSKFYNPIHYSIFDSVTAQIKFLEQDYFKNSGTALFFRNVLNGDLSKNGNANLNVPALRETFYTAKSHFANKRYHESKTEIEKIVNEVDDISYIKEQCIKFQFFNFVELLEYDNAIDLYVNNYILNSIIVSKINAEEFSNIIVQKKWKGVNTSNINFPIFIFLTHEDIPSKYIAYDLFMRTQKITLPSELNHIDSFGIDKVIFFLKNVAVQKIISLKAVIFKNSTEVLNERIAICQLLSKIDIKSIDEYSKEISDITQRITVQQRVKEVDDSKIFIDETGILEKELNEVQKNFNRFKSISQLLKENNIDATGIGYDALYDLLKGKIDTETYQKSLRKTDVQFELFTQLFLEIRDKFLFSNQYGLDYYLSQRIRHGSIVNQIRKSFKTHNLVTTKSSKSEEYLPNIFWLNKLELPDKLSEQFNARMSLFSINIDKIISNLKNNFIQIKTEDPKSKQSGWFDYMYIPIWDKSYLYELYIKELQFTTDFNDFVKPMFEVLWNMTERNLEYVRNMMNSKIKLELIKELELLEIDLKKLLSNKNIPNLYRAIADCRTNVQADIDYAIRWFNKSKNYEIDFSIEDAFNTSLQIVNNIISPTILEIQIENRTSNSLIKGIYFTHFVDLIKIFLTNISDYYSKVEIEEKTASILMSQNDDLLLLEFSNSLRKGEDVNELRKTIERKQAIEQTNIKGIRGEGSTGFPKANNILKNVFRNNNNIYFEINENRFVVKCDIILNNLAI
jgi:hypothetical protein